MAAHAEERDLWRSAPALMQQVRRRDMEAWPGRRARRALFDPADHDETRRFVKEELAAIRAADQHKYNFDFENMVPKAGCFEWEPVAPGEVSPAYGFGRLQGALHRSARRLDFDERPSTPEPRTPGLSAPEPCAPDSSASEPNTAASSAAATSLATAETCPAAAPPQTAPAPQVPARQTTITDFWRSRKRPSAVPPCGDPASKRPSPAAPAAAPTVPTPSEEGQGCA